MKKLFLLCILSIIFSNLLYSQIASTYFPSGTGYRWYFKNTPLDSLNVPITSAATYQIDSFATNENYQGLLASIVLSKIGLTNFNQNLPYLDSNYYNFQTSNAWKYLRLFGIDSFGIDIGIINFLRSFENWYSTYRFAQTVNTNYTIISRDTTISIDTLVLPLRVSSVGRRLNDKNVSTVNGTYLAKKFVITNSLFYLLSIPPFPVVPIPILQQPDTSWIASGIWTVKELIPSTNVDLNSFGFPVSFSIPGNLKELASPTIGINNYSNQITKEYKLYQNYPNPFNPKTIINYQIPSKDKGQTSNVKLVIYNELGKEIITLVNEKQNSGAYSVEWDASGFSSGIYFYELKGDGFTQTRKMIVLK